MKSRLIVGHEQKVLDEGKQLKLKKREVQNAKKPDFSYLLNSFPCLTETFILQEVLELERQGALMRLFALARPKEGQNAQAVWDGQAKIVYIAHFSRWVLFAITLWRLLKAPYRFLRTAVILMVHYRLRSVIRYLVYASYLAQQLEREGIPHLHTHFATEPTAIAQTVRMLTGISYSFTAHAYDIYLTSKAELAYKIQMARFISTCSIYNQNYLRGLVDKYTGKRIHCIHYGLNLDMFPVHNYIIPPSGRVPLILTVSRLVEKKGLLYLLLACRLLKDQGYDFICRIVGEGAQRPVLEEKIRELALADRVELLGAAKHEQVIEMYQQATIVALPCVVAKNGDRDGIPLALIEALCMRIPAISTPVSGVPELITSEVNGLLIPPQDSAALASALARLLDDPALGSRLAEAGRQTILDEFDVARNATRLLHLLCACQED